MLVVRDGKGEAFAEALIEEAKDTGMETFLPEILRLKGEYSASAGPVGPAGDLFRRSIEIARHQQAKMRELRTSTSLARLLQAHGDRNAARDLLAPIYNWFTESFDTADLKDAKALLEELSNSQ